jgi:integrase
MRRVLLPVWGTLPLAVITRKHVIEVVYRVHDGGSPVSANRLLAYIKTFFSWAVQRGKVDSSPASLVKKPAKERARDHVLADPELRAIWRACEWLGAFGRAVQFMVCTGCRRTEAGSAAWSEIDRDAKLWRLPAGRVKNNRSHQLPLNDLALSRLGEANGEYLFSNDSSKTPINGWSKGKTRLDVAALDELRKERPDAVMADWHLHDVRRSVATNLARLGVDRTIVARILNHADNTVTGRHYDKHGRNEEMVAALAAWDRRLRQIIDPLPADVVPLARLRRP